MNAKKAAPAKTKLTASGRIEKLLANFRSARDSSAPLVCVNTPDQGKTIQRLIGTLRKGEPAVRWDCVSGLRAGNEAGQSLIEKIDSVEQASSVNLVDALMTAAKFPQETCLLLWNAHRQLHDTLVVQALCNLRDPFKGNTRTVVLLAPQATLPPEIANDTVVLDEPLPDRDELEELIRETYSCMETAGEPTQEVIERAKEATQGLHAFAVDQFVAMSFDDAGEKLRIEELWEHKRRQIEATPGLSVDHETFTFADIGGLGIAKEFGERLFSGNAAPSVVCRIEEIEKVMSGARGDTSGVSQDSLQVLLNAMEDKGWSGMIAFGPPGGGKSLFSKSLANTFERLSLAFDLNATKGSLVGESEGNVRRAVKVIEAVAGDQAFFVATANSLDSLPPELRRRFRYGIWMFDLPDADEADAIWRLNQSKYGLPEDAERPEGVQYSGAEIRNICELAWRLNCSLVEASRYIVAVSVSDRESVDRCRTLAEGKFLSASFPGVYRKESAFHKNGQPEIADGSRRLRRV